MRRDKQLSVFRKICLAVIAMLLACGLSNAGEIWSQLGILDLANANGGTNPVTGLAWAKKDKYRLAFVTIATTNAVSADINDYNAFVQNVAAGSSAFPNLGDVTWKAVGSTATVDARDNTDSNTNVVGTGVAIFLLNGTTKVADNYADLWDGAPDNRISITEENTARAKDTPVWTSWTAVWTGTTGPGTQSSPLGGANVRHGLIYDQLTMWLNRSTAANATLLPMYALSEVLTVQGTALGTLVLIK